MRIVEIPIFIKNVLVNHGDPILNILKSFLMNETLVENVNEDTDVTAIV